MSREREHHKEHKSKRSHDRDRERERGRGNDERDYYERTRDSHGTPRSHKHKPHHSNKVSKTPKSPKKHKSRRRISESPPPLRARDVEYSPEPFREPVCEPPKPSKAKSPKPTKPISIRGIFNRSKHHPPPPKKKKAKKLPEPDHPLSIELQGHFETAFQHLRLTTNDAFDTTRAQFTERLEKTRAKDVEMIKSVTAAAESLRAPLVDERVEIIVDSGGKREKHTVTLGRRIDSFKNSIAEEEARLTELWSQWHAIQDEYNQLGLEVFGIEALGDRPVGDVPRHVHGYKSEMEELDLQHNSAVEELNEEIGELGMRSIMRLKTTEKELDKAAKKDQELFLRTLLFV